MIYLILKYQQILMKKLKNINKKVKKTKIKFSCKKIKEKIMNYYFILNLDLYYKLRFVLY